MAPRCPIRESYAAAGPEALEALVEACRAYAAGQFMQDGAVYSGDNTIDRAKAQPSLAALLAAACNNDFQRVLIQDVSRLSHDRADAARVLRTVTACDAEVHTLHSPVGVTVTAEPCAEPGQSMKAKDLSPLAAQIGLCRAWAERLGFKAVRVSVQGVDPDGLLHGWTTASKPLPATDLGSAP